jgi:hypothetical protein
MSETSVAAPYLMTEAHISTFTFSANVFPVANT